MTTLPFLILGSLSLLLLNWLTWKGLKNYLQPKGKTAATALEQQLTEQAFAWRTLIGLLWLVPVWPSIAAVMLQTEITQADTLPEPYLPEMRKRDPPRDVGTGDKERCPALHPTGTNGTQSADRLHPCVHLHRLRRKGESAHPSCDRSL